MSKKYIVIGVAVLALVGLFMIGGSSKPYAGGSFNSVMVDFAQGISVDGTTVISGSGAWVGTGTEVTAPLTLDDSLTVGEDDTGFDVKFYGGTAGNYWQWTGDDNEMLIVGSARILGTLTHKMSFIAPGDDLVLAQESGSVIEMNTAGEDVTLPAVASASGKFYRFTVTAAVATTNMTVVSAEGDNIEGSLVVAGAIVNCDAVDAINFVIDGEDIGDFVELYSNGTNWFIGSSNALTTAKMTCTG